MDDKGALRFRCPCCDAILVLEDLEVRAGAEDARGELLIDIRGKGDAIEAIVGELEGQMVEMALREAGGVKARAAELLGLKYSTFWELAQRVGIDASEAPEDAAPAESIAAAVGVVVRLHDDSEPALEIRVPLDRELGLHASVVLATKRAVAHRALGRAGGSVARAAELTGMKYSTFHSLLTRLEPAETAS